MINLTQHSKITVESLFEKSLKVKSDFKKSAVQKTWPEGSGTAALLFFESSTRTRFSFESAAIRAGYYPLVLDINTGTSLEKGESVIDTIRNIEAMRPSFFVIRCDKNFDLQKLSEQISVPVINAGWGIQGHPTQALLDSLTLFEKWQTLENKKILFVGDVKHSRVVASHLELSKILNYKIGLCAPQEFQRENAILDCLQFDKLETGLRWADAVIALRVQKERHDGKNFDSATYRLKYGLTESSIKSLGSSAFIMHPGPINYGTELDENILQDSRSLILKQVENGVFLREALIRNIDKEINA